MDNFMFQGKAGTVINNSLVTNKRPESVSRGG